jgi:hypothetical protein
VRDRRFGRPPASAWPTVDDLAGKGAETSVRGWFDDVFFNDYGSNRPYIRISRPPSTASSMPVM